MKHWLRYVVVFTLLSSALVGCNTMEGAGEDVQEVGEEIEDAAN